jgi:hypothetical protein
MLPQPETPAFVVQPDDAGAVEVRIEAAVAAIATLSAEPTILVRRHLADGDQRDRPRVGGEQHEVGRSGQVGWHRPGRYDINV